MNIVVNEKSWVEMYLPKDFSSSPNQELAQEIKKKLYEARIKHKVFSMEVYIHGYLIAGLSPDAMENCTFIALFYVMSAK